MRGLTFRYQRRNAERGQVFIIVAGGMVVLLGMLALAVDLGYWRNQQRQEQSAADSAAMAGTIATYYTTTAGSPAPPEVTAAATRAATKNGYTDDGGVTTKIVVNNFPLSGTHTTDPAAVEVIVTKKQPVFFAGIFRHGTQTVSARAVATHVQDAAPACIYQLDTTVGIQLNSGQITAKNCNVALNYPPSGNNCFVANNVVYYGTSFGKSKPNICNTANPPPVAAANPVPNADPCYLIRGCSYLMKSTFPTSGPNVRYGILTPTIFSPGIYYIYGDILAGISGTDVTIVHVTGLSLFNGALNSPSIVAPSTGPTAGVAYYQPPSNTSQIRFNGTISSWLGLFYAPTGSILSNGKSDIYSSIVIGSYRLNGNKNFFVDPSTAPAGVAALQGTTHAALGE